MRFAGASGYLLKRTPPAKLVESLREVVSGGAPMSPEVANRVISLFKNIRPPERSDHHLTPHELRLLKMLVEGHSYKTAAAELGSSINTIGTHAEHLSQAASSLQIRSGGKSHPQRVSLKTSSFHQSISHKLT